MKLILEGEQNTIIGFSMVGNLDNSKEFDGVVPDGFFNNFAPNKFILQNENIVLNEQYQTPVLEIPTVDGIDPIDGMAKISQQIVLDKIEQAKFNAVLLKQMASLMVEKGTTNG